MLMKACLLILINSFLLPLAICQELELPASEIVWDGIFGCKKDEPSTTYCLMGNGFFRAPRSNEIDEVVTNWVAEHPMARVIPVSTFQPVMEDDPKSKMVYVWLVDGESNLNVQLVSLGCCSSSTMQATMWSNLHIQKKDYEQFGLKIIQAEQQAKLKKIGIWKEEQQ
jgi:hypothetical protein